MNRVSLMSSTMAVPTIGFSRFFPMRQQAQEQGGGGGGASESSAAENNTGGNSGESENNNSSEDNGGQKPDLSKFWEEPKEEGDGSNESDDTASQESQALGTELKQAIDGFAPPPTFSKDVAEAIANGDFESVNKALADAHRQTIQQSIVLTAKMVGKVMERMQSDFDARIQKALGNEANNSFLESQFPLAKNPQYRPVVERVWNQALKNSKGDRNKAISLTRGMLEAFGSEVAPNLRDAPDDPTAGINTAASKRLVDDLLNRG